MAELIPLNYRIRLATRKRTEMWAIVALAALVVAGPIVGWAYVQERASGNSLAQLKQQFEASSSLIHRSEELRRDRQQLADRMSKIQALMDDHVLLALLKHLSSGFVDTDALQSLHIDTRPPFSNDATLQSARDGYFSAKVTGITSSTGSLAELMTRLGAKGAMPVHVSLEDSKRIPFMDGQVVQFDLIFEKGNG